MTACPIIIDNSQAWNPHWWIKIEPAYRGLLRAIKANDTAYIAAYMDSKKSATFAAYHWKA